MHRFIPYVLLVIFSGICSSATLNAQCKVISYNIRYDNPSDSLNNWSQRKKSISDFLMQQQADFIGLQEVLVNQLIDLDSMLNQQPVPAYSWVGVGRDDGKQVGEFCPIFYNNKNYKLLAWETRWLSETPNRPSKSWDAALPRIATIAKFLEFKTRREFVIINTHLDHQGEQARFKSSKLLFSWIDTLLQQSTPVLLLGDFNADRKSNPVRWLLTSQQLSMANAKINPNERGTFNGFSNQPGKEIDFIFYSNHFQLNSASIDYTQRGEGLFLSDHYPVIATFENSIPNFNLSICYPGAWTVQKLRAQAEFPLSEKQSLGISLTRLNVLWQTQTLGLEYRKYPTVSRNAKSGYYAQGNFGFGKADYYSQGIFTAFAFGVVKQQFYGKSKRFLFEYQLGGRAGVMVTGDLESGGGFGGLLYIAGPLSVLDFRMNMGYRF
jgi:endonuclease/exonuclease/phosphatase family metal-dependent hydrolase